MRYNIITDLLYYISVDELEYLIFTEYNYSNPENPLILYDYLDDVDIYIEMFLTAALAQYEYFIIYTGPYSKEDYFQQIQYMLLDQDVSEYDYYVLDMYKGSLILKSVEEFEDILGRSLTELEIELVNQVNYAAAQYALKNIISEKEHRLFDYLTIAEKREIYQLIDLYLVVSFELLSLEDLLDSETAYSVLGRYLTETETELITFLFS